VPTQRGLNFQYYMGGSGIRNHWSIVRNGRRNEAVAHIAGQAKPSCKQYRSATRAVSEALTTPNED